MKSVVVEASTVAKAIETAWHKAEKPEEFFIRVLQEHQSGFLGFGSQKAKIVFFFKNSQKSDSLFPVVLKQKEYTNLFENNHLKVPAQLGIIDDQLNKNISLVGQKKKTQHLNQQQKNKKNQQSDVGQIAQHHKLVAKNSQVSHVGLVKNNKQGQVLQQKPVHKAVHDKHKESLKLQNFTHQVKTMTAHASKPVDLEKNTDYKQVENEAKSLDQKLHLKIALEESNQDFEHKEKAVFFDKKDDIVKDIARTLKKVQSQKIVAHVSRQVSEKIEDLKAKTFDLSADQKSSVVLFEEKIEKVKADTPVVLKVVTKFKRRPLPVDGQSVSGIKPRVIKKESDLADDVDEKK